MNGTISLTSAGVSSRVPSTPHESDDAMRRLSSSIRSGVRATSMPPVSLKTPSSWYWPRAVDREGRHLLAVVGQEDEVRGVARRAAGVWQRALLEQDDVAPAGLGEVVGHAVADDPGTDDHDVRPVGKRAHSVPSSAHLTPGPWAEILARGAGAGSSGAQPGTPP